MFDIQFLSLPRYLKCQDPACNGVKEVHVKVEQQEAPKLWTHEEVCMQLAVDDYSSEPLWF